MKKWIARNILGLKVLDKNKYYLKSDIDEQIDKLENQISISNNYWFRKYINKTPSRKGAANISQKRFEEMKNFIKLILINFREKLNRR